MLFFLNINLNLGDPLVTTVLVRAKDGGSMHRLRYLNEAVQLHTFIRQNISAQFVNEGEKNAQAVRYADICGSFCDTNIIIEYFYVSLKNDNFIL